MLKGQEVVLGEQDGKDGDVASSFLEYCSANLNDLYQINLADCT